jgi:pimeloyl-ACP methyl ester carboxylesterase
MGRFVLVHGAWHGPWCWDRVTGPLRELGHTVVASELPFTGLERDTAVAQADVERLAVDGPVVVCSHSYGGAVVTGLQPDGLAHVVCIAGFLLDVGESVFDAGRVEAPGTALADALVRGDDGLTRVDPSRAADVFYADCTPADQEWAIEHLRGMAMSGMGGSPATQSWRAVPTTYAVCTDDQVVHPMLQRHLAKRAGGTVAEWPTSHSPFLSRPDLVIDLLRDLGADRTP